MSISSDTFRRSYIAVAEAAVNVLEKVPGSLDEKNEKHSHAVLALLQLAAALEEAREIIRSAPNEQ